MKAHASAKHQAFLIVYVDIIHDINYENTNVLLLVSTMTVSDSVS